MSGWRARRSRSASRASSPRWYGAACTCASRACAHSSRFDARTGDRRGNARLCSSNEGREMKYMLLIYGVEDAWIEGERERCYVESAQLTQELHTKGQYLGASPLQPVSTATSVRVRDGKRMV